MWYINHRFVKKISNFSTNLAKVLVSAKSWMQTTILLEICT